MSSAPVRCQAKLHGGEWREDIESTKITASSGAFMIIYAKTPKQKPGISSKTKQKQNQSLVHKHCG
jgi:hypothetical protein